MLKLASQGVAARLIQCVGNLSATSSSQNVAPAAITATQKFLSQSQGCYKKLMINDHYDFDKKVINSDNPVIVNFHAEWCDPCKILTPKMIELLENSNEIDLAVIDVETLTDLVETFEVQAVPAVLAFRHGVVVDKFIGLVDANSIETLIHKLKKKTNETNTSSNSSNPKDAGEVKSK